MKWQDVCEALFGPDHGIVEQDELLRGSAVFDGEPLDVLGTTHHAAIGYAMALRQARAVLDTVQRSPGRTLLLLVDTQGQRLRRHDELLGIHRAMAHLGCCIDLARRRGHRVIGLVYDQALSGGSPCPGRKSSRPRTGWRNSTRATAPWCGEPRAASTAG